MASSIITGSLVIGPMDTPDDYQPYERFALTVNPDGTRTLRTVTHSPNGNVFRDVHQSVQANWRPIEGYARLYVEDEYQGTIWRRVVGDRVISHFAAPDGTFDTVEFPAPPNLILGFHPVTADAWKACFYDIERGGTQPVNVLTVSPTWNGRTLGHGVARESEMEYLGREMVTVPAGTFECDGFLWHSGIDHELELWRTGEHHLFVKLVARARRTVYQLAALEYAAR